MELKLNVENFEDWFPNASTSFATIMNGRFTPNKTMRKGDSFNTIRYLDLNDLIAVSKKRMEQDSSYRREKNAVGWKYLITRAEQLLNE